jgi:tripartite-type tricarboxylate transporter receptor subunit TctC
MKMRQVARSFTLALLVLVALLSDGVWAQSDYPSRPVRIVVPFAPGGTVDVVARIVGDKMGQRLGQAFIVENRPGGNGIPAAGEVLGRPADGYTLMPGAATNYSTIYMRNPPFDFLKEFTPVSQFYGGAYFFVVRADLPVRGLKEFVEYARARPGKLNFGEGSTNSALVMAAFTHPLGLDVLDVPYKSTAPAIAALLAGDVHVILDTLAATRALVDSGKLRLLAVTGMTRSPAMPDVPTVGESGLPPLNATFRSGLWARSGTPRPIVGKLSSTLAEVMKQPEVRQSVASAGLIPTATTPEEFARITQEELEFWRGAAKLANYQPE